MKLVKIVLGLGFLLTVSFNANANTTETVISEKTFRLPVDISTAQVRKTNAGYGELYLVKVLIPGLAAVTVLNHRNVGENAPCMATYETTSIEDVIQNNPATEHYDITVTQTKLAYPDWENTKCIVHLQEKVSAKIRGYNFVHSASTPLQERHIDDCK
ncbi:hypothetical protein ACLWBD_04195 [Bdellovibrio sp. HCB117]|uniref:hypothetical protein n=1 Tax=Bdellovibrio sp. HCB117 TaxID=3394359 RepID=UPI0039B60BDD